MHQILTKTLKAPYGPLATKDPLSYEARSGHKSLRTVEPHFSANDGAKFTVIVEADPLNAAHFRWEIHEGDQIHMRSPHAYETREEAEEEANVALEKFIANWRAQ